MGDLYEMSFDMIRCSIQSLALLAAIAATGCSSAPTTQPSKENGEEITKASEPVIVQIVSRDSRITVRSTSAGPTYSVSDANGTTVVPAMSLPQLQANHPELARHINTMNAAASNTAWAGVE